MERFAVEAGGLRNEPLDRAQQLQGKDPTLRPFGDAVLSTPDGRVDVNFTFSSLRRLLRHSEQPAESHSIGPPPYTEVEWNTPLNIVIQIVGSRGDVQPFIALGCELQRLSHRVRIATHELFKEFVESAGLEFFPIGGDPTDLMAYMVKNPGLLPTLEILRCGDVSEKREMMRQVLHGCWKSCILPCPETRVPFVANAIIANPPSFAHVHCAQALGVPLHMMFTMPWSPTAAFPHPLANIRNELFPISLANYHSYYMVSCLTWSGLSDLINSFRKYTLGLEPVPFTEGPVLLEKLRIPHTYCWSPSLIPKPVDWPVNIDVCGFFFRRPPSYTPPARLLAFLENGPPPVYIGFGSIVVSDSASLTTTILDALSAAGVRAIVSAGWSSLSKPSGTGQTSRPIALQAMRVLPGRLDGTESGPPVIDSDQVLFLETDVPHEWLFSRVSMVVHHGGAGTTACGLRNARPTVVVPFFGDQQHWGSMVASAGVGPPPIPQRQLTAEALASAIRFCDKDEVRKAAFVISLSMEKEDGIKEAVTSFHRNLRADRMTCDLITGAATWTVTRNGKKSNLCNAAAEILTRNGLVRQEELRMYMPVPLYIEHTRWDPATGVMAALAEAITNMLEEVAGFWKRPLDMNLQRHLENGTHLEPTAKQVVAMTAASLSSAPRFVGIMLKGFVVDVPYAVAEGFRTLPSMYGGEVKPRDPITDWRSGGTVAMKNFAVGTKDVIPDTIGRSIAGYDRCSTTGGTKAVAKSLADSIASTGSALVGLAAYPGQGLVKTLHSLTHQRVPREIIQARWSEVCLARTGENTRIEVESQVIKNFQIRHGY